MGINIGAGIAQWDLGYGLDDRGSESQQGLGIFFFTAASRPALGPTQPRPLSLGVKRSDHPLPSSAEVRMHELYLHSPNMPSWHGAQLKARGQLYLYLEE